jgi:hypothetical protein
MGISDREEKGIRRIAGSVKEIRTRGNRSCNRRIIIIELRHGNAQIALLILKEDMAIIVQARHYQITLRLDHLGRSIAQRLLQEELIPVPPHSGGRCVALEDGDLGIEDTLPTTNIESRPIRGCAEHYPDSI